ncbi:MAG: hypothetical protein QOE70_5129 [Chthoniobacter sp.]|jgi:hypothetical protein|nr:hypothetical protein [Chthoniobacter sp.]
MMVATLLRMPAFSKTMKATLLLVAAGGIAAQAMALEGPAIPSSFPAERYERMVQRSPFALATAPAAAAIPEKNFADGWYVSGLARVDGKDFVTIKSRDLSVQFSLFGNEPREAREDAPEKGVTLQSVDWSPSIGRSTVTIVRDGLPATLEFNQAELQGAANAMQPGNQGLPPGMARPNPMPMPMPVTNALQPRNAIPRPSQPIVTNPGIPKPQTYPITGAAKPVVQPPPGNEGRRRIRVINSAPQQ